MANVVLGVTGSVAAIRTAALVAGLRAAGHEVNVAATEASLYFFAPADLPVGTRLYRDRDEWPRREGGGRWQRDEAVLHIELRRWASVLVVAPLDANTLAKLAVGLSDNLLTCVMRAWDFDRPLVLAPAMNTLMWNSPVTARHLRTLWADHGQGCSRGRHDGPAVATAGESREGDPQTWVEAINTSPGRLRVVPPVYKQLACGDWGTGAMADVCEIVEAVNCQLASR